MTEEKKSYLFALLTTIFKIGGKPPLPVWVQGFLDLANRRRILCNAAETRVNTGFSFDGLKTPTL